MASPVPPNGATLPGNPANANPSRIPAGEQAAVAQVVNQDAARGAQAYAFNPDASPEDKAAATVKKGGFGNKVFGAPKALGKGVFNAGQAGVGAVGKGVGAVGQGVGAVGGAAVQGVGAVGGAAVKGVGAVGGAAVQGVGSAGKAASSAIGATGSNVKNLVGSVPGMGQAKATANAQPRALGVDLSRGDAPAPTVSLADAKKATDAAAAGTDFPGNYPATVLPGIPGWVPKGWKQVGGAEIPGVDPETKGQMTLLKNYISEQYYGGIIHNAGVIVFAVLSTRIITMLGLGWATTLIILAACATYYTMSIRRTRVRARDEIQRELIKTRLVNETESCDWINQFLDRFWLIYEPVLSASLVGTIDGVLEQNTPGFLESIRLTSFTLGNKAPRVDYVRTFPHTPDDVVVMDWAVSFTPNDIMDITAREAERRVNPKIVLTIRVGKGIVSAPMPILLEDINFSGKMRIKLQLMTNFPHIQRAELMFLEPPQFDYVLKPIGGDTFGFDINSIPGLAPFIRDQVHANLGPMMYDPNVFTVDVEQMMSGTPLDAAIGVLKVKVLDAHGLKSSKLGGGSPDPYVTFSLGNKEPVARTKTISSNSNPSFNETHFILVNNLNDVLNLNVFDFNELQKDSRLGTASQELSVLLNDAEQEALTGKVLGDGKERGDIRYDLSWYPVIQPTKNPDGTFEPVSDIPTGIARITIHQAKDFDNGSKKMYPQASVYLGGQKEPILNTKIFKKSDAPVWEDHAEFLVADKNASVVTIRVKDTGNGNANLGGVTIKLTDIMKGKAEGNDWFPLQGTRAGKVRLTVDFRPVAMAGVIDGASSYVPPIGILRLHIKGAADIKNSELAGKSDSYLRVQHNNKTLARTEIQNNTLNPVWDQIIYVPVHTPRERIVLELMDHENIGKDKSLGYVQLEAADYIEEDSGNVEYPYRTKGAQHREDRIFLGKANQYKGILSYGCDFKPAVSLRGGVSFDAKKNDLEAAADTQAKAVAAPAVNGGQANGAGAAAAQAGTAAGTSAAAGQAAATTAAKDGEAAPTEAEKPETGVVLTREQLLHTQSGILVFQVISGQLAKKGILEIMLDDGYWPVYQSERARSTHATWDQVGEGFVRELDFGRTWLRLNGADEDNDEPEVIAELQMDTREFLERALDKPTDFVLARADGSNRSMVSLSARYIPVAIQLEPRESILDQGMLRVQVISGKGLLAADRGGKSDPNITFHLNGNKVFKSETIKKTVNPQWNERFETPVPSRVLGKFTFEVNDFNTLGTADELGEGVIDLSQLEPNVNTPVDIPVAHKGQPAGTIQLGLLFNPSIVARTRSKAGISRTVTSIGGAALGAPVAVGKGVITGVGVVGGAAVHGVGAVGSGAVNAGGAVIGGVGKGVGAVVGAPGKLFKKRGTSVSSNQPPPPVIANDSPMMGGSPVAGYAVGPDGQPEVLAQHGQPPTGAADDMLPVPGSTHEEAGVLSVTVMTAADIRAMNGGTSGLKPYVQLRCAGKSYKTDHVRGTEGDFHETFNFNVQPGVNSFNVTVFDKHAFGKDTELGTADVDIWRHVQAAMPSADVVAELTGGGGGVVRLRLDWQAGAQQGGSKFLTRTRSRTASVTSRQGVSQLSTPQK